MANRHGWRADVTRETETHEERRRERRATVGRYSRPVPVKRDRKEGHRS